MTKYFWIALALPLPGMAQVVPVAQPVAQSAMAGSLDKQRASVLRQATSLTGVTVNPAGSFFSVPWIDPTWVNHVDTVPGVVAAPPPPCDPVPHPKLDALIEQNAKSANISADLIRAVIGQESGNRPCAVSLKGALGLMQLMPATASQFSVVDPFDPKQNVEAGTKLLQQLLAKYKNDTSLALAAYNAGSDRVDREGGIPNIAETRNYVTQIMAKLPKFR